MSKNFFLELTLINFYTACSTVGDGTEANPYNIDQAMLLEIGEGTKKIWIKGYIVGGYSDSGGIHKFTAVPFKAAEHFLALAVSSTESEYQMTFPVNFIKVASSSKVKAKTNIKDNPSNLGSEISMKGDIDWFFSVNGSLALIKVEKAILNGVTIEGSSY